MAYITLNHSNTKHYNKLTYLQWKCILLKTERSLTFIKLSIRNGEWELRYFMQCLKIFKMHYFYLFWEKILDEFAIKSVIFEDVRSDLFILSDAKKFVYFFFFSLRRYRLIQSLYIVNRLKSLAEHCCFVDCVRIRTNCCSKLNSILTFRICKQKLWVSLNWKIVFQFKLHLSGLT